MQVMPSVGKCCKLYDWCQVMLVMSSVGNWCKCCQVLQVMSSYASVGKLCKCDVIGESYTSDANWCQVKYKVWSQQLFKL